jgi:hypothetical protein
MADTPGRVTARLGVFRFPGLADDKMSCIYLDAPGPAEKSEVARLILACQNGSCTLVEGAPRCHMGDTAVRVSLRAERGSETALLDVSARLSPGHLTHAFVFRGQVERWKAVAFLQVFERTQHYVLTVAENGKLDLDTYVVKYHVEGGFRVRG